MQRLTEFFYYIALRLNMAISTQINIEQQKLKDAVSYALTLAQKKADQAEVSVNKSTGIQISTRHAETENIEFNSEGGLGITVFVNQRKGTASTSDLSPKAIEQSVQAALDIAHYTSEDPFSGLADQALLAFDIPDLDLFHPSELTTEQGIELAAKAEQIALSADKRIVETEGGSFSSHQGIYVYGNSHGMLQSYCSSQHSISCSVVAKENEQMVRDYAYTVARDIRDLRSAEWVGQDCTKKTIARLSARRIKTQTAPILFAPRVSSGLFSHLAGAISGGSLYRRMSFLLDSLGKSILPEWLNIVEHPHILKALGSSAFDAEGVKTHNRQIVENGILQSYLLGSYSARKLGMQSTGHASGITNWIIAGKQQHDFKAMLKLLDRGLLVTELIGQGVNGVTGDYSRGAAGFWVENGEIQYPVHEITIAGNLKEMLMGIIDIGHDQDTPKKIDCGSVLIEQMKIAGQ